MTPNQYVDGTYLEKVPDWHAGDSPWKAAAVHRMIQKHRLSPRSVYDIGCGAGEVLAELQKRMPENVEFTGFDISPQALALAETNANPRLIFCEGDFLATSTPTPDLALVLDVFEHVSDYLGFLERLRKKTNWIMFHIPIDICANAVLKKSSWMLHMREKYGHLHYFTKDTAIATLGDIGYHIIDWCYTDDLTIAANPPEWIRPRVIYEIRARMFRIHQDAAVSLFDSYNVLLLARGDMHSAGEPAML
jgi:SAM-dependent methyltransferase